MVDLDQDFAGPARLPGIAIQAQADRLGSGQLQRAQRQALAAQIGRMQGNHHLQRMIVAVGAKSPNPESRREVEGSLGRDAVDERVHIDPVTVSRNVGLAIQKKDPEPVPPWQKPPQSVLPPASAGGAAPAPKRLPPTSARQLLYAKTTLSRVKSLDKGARATLEKAIPGAVIFALIKERDRKLEILRKKDVELTRLRQSFGVPEPVPQSLARVHGIPPTHKVDDPLLNQLTREINALVPVVERLNAMIHAALRPLKISTEKELVTLVSETFPGLFIERAKQIALVQLDQNRELAQKEADRYKVDTGKPKDIKGLRSAAAHLHKLDQEIGQLSNELSKVRTAASPTMPKHGMPKPEELGSSYYDLDRLGKQISQKMKQFNDQKKAYALQYPILFQQINLRALAEASDQQLASLVGAKIRTIIENIDETKKNIQDPKSGLKVWSMPSIMAMTRQDMGIEKNSVLQAVINSHIKKEKSKKSLLDKALTALSITAGIIAGIALAMSSGGLALIAGGAALGAGGYLAAKHVQQFLAQKKAQNVALDPIVARLTTENPALFWLILELVGVGLDAVGVGQAFKILGVPAKALMATGKIFRFVKAVGRAGLEPAAARRVIARAVRQANVAGRIRQTIAVIGSTFRRADLSAISIKIRRYAAKGFDELYRQLRARGNIHVLEKNVVKKALGEKEYKKLKTLGYFNKKVRGFYHEATGKLFVRKDAPFTEIVSYVVHELVHHLQKRMGRKLTEFEAEFQAFWMQRDFLRRLAKAAGEDAVPADMHWLLKASVQDLEFKILKMYKGSFKPAGLDYLKLVLETLERLRVLR